MPLMSLVVTRVPCKASDEAVTVTPGKGRLSGEATRPLSVPYCCPCAEAAAAPNTTIAAVKNETLRLMTSGLLTRSSYAHELALCAGCSHAHKSESQFNESGRMDSG